MLASDSVNVYVDDATNLDISRLVRGDEAIEDEEQIQIRGRDAVGRAVAVQL
jgi:hypothetical protein